MQKQFALTWVGISTYVRERRLSGQFIDPLKGDCHLASSHLVTYSSLSSQVGKTSNMETRSTDKQLYNRNHGAPRTYPSTVINQSCITTF
jgi:hypothetical protein